MTWMERAQLTHGERTALLERYFDPVTAAQRDAIEVAWASACADPKEVAARDVERLLRPAKEGVAGMPDIDTGYLAAWVEDVRVWRPPTPSTYFCGIVAQKGLARPVLAHASWAVGQWEWVSVTTDRFKGSTEEALTAVRLWDLRPGRRLRTAGDPRFDRARWFTRDVVTKDALGEQTYSTIGVIRERIGYLDQLDYWPTRERTESTLILSDLTTSESRRFTLRRLPAHVTIIPGAPRSRYEVDYFIAGSRCHACDGAGLGRVAPQYGAGTVSGFCGKCQAMREFRFVPVTSSGPIEPFHMAPGTEASTVYDAAELRALADAALATVPRNPTEHPTVAAYTEARKALVRGYTALVELAKHRADDRELAEEIAATDALYEAYDAAKTAVASRPGAQPAPRGIEDRLRQHQAWVARGGAGDGRLEFRDEVWTGGGFDYARWSRIRMVGTRFERVDLRHADLTEAELERSQLLECRLSSSTWNRARLTSCDLRGSRLGLADLDATEVVGGDWREVFAGRTRWRASTMRDVDLRGAALTDSELSAVVFERCDLRSANLGRLDYQLKLGQFTDVRFVDCDLRGAKLDGAILLNVQFVRCKLADIEGTPEVRSQTAATDCDLSPSGDGSAGGGAELLALWKARAKRR